MTLGLWLHLLPALVAYPIPQLCNQLHCEAWDGVTSFDIVLIMCRVSASERDQIRYQLLHHQLEKRHQSTLMERYKASIEGSRTQ